MTQINAAILGASGYTGAELLRLLAGHDSICVQALTADRKAGSEAAAVFPHLAGLGLPALARIEDVDFTGIQLAFCALPHGVTQDIVPDLPDHLAVVDLSADFRLRDPDEYQRWYGAPHRAPHFLDKFVYGLPEAYREQIRGARFVACTGCYVATALTPLIPLVEAGVIDPDDVVIDAKSGVSGAGRSAKEAFSFCEVGEGCAPYSVGAHRHMAEIEQELGRACGRPVRTSFTPHLLPMSRGILATIYVAGEAERVRQCLEEKYAGDPFVQVLGRGQLPRTQDVRGSNLLRIGVAEDRRAGRSVVLATLDNLVKGASGQAVQNANLMHGFPETTGLPQAPMVP